MADIQYLNYGDLQIELLAFLTKAADEVTNYVNSQPWSKKRKEKFMSAYSDIMTKGVKGASNNTGRWMLDINDNIDLDSMDKKDKEMYLEAAYFIRNLMSSINPSSQLKEDEKNKVKFDNKTFLSNFKKHISNKLLGGRELIISGGDDDEWNHFDKRDENGIRGRKNRANKLAELLQSYSDSLTEDSYDFKDSPFTNLNDFKIKIQNAVNALKTDSTDDDRDALNAIGINEKDWFNNGSGDPSGEKDEAGNELTYGQLAERNGKLAEQKLLEEKNAAIAKEKANLGVINTLSGIHSVEARTQPEAYKQYLSQLGTGQLGFNAVNLLVQGLLEKGYSPQGLNSSEKKLLGNLLYFIRTNNPNYIGLGWGLKTNITDLEWNEFLIHNKFAGSNKNNFVRLPWQTSDGRYTFADNQGNIYYLKPSNLQKFGTIPVNRDLKYKNYLNNFLLSKQGLIDKAQLEYLKSTGFSDADIAELTGIGLDIASIVDPEPISAGVAGVAAAGARNYARAQDPKDWSWDDYLWLGVDYLTGAVGAIPVLGDAALAYKVTKNVAKWGKRALTIPAVWDMISHSPGALTAVNKAIGGESLTVEDWRNLGSFVRGLTGTRNITVQNRAARRVLLKRGYDLSGLNGILKRTGLWDTSVPKSQSTVKINVKGSDGKVATKEVVIKDKKALEKKLLKAGNDLAKKSDVIKETQEVKDYMKSKNLKPEDVSAVESSSLLNTRVGKHVGVFPKWARRTSDNFGSKSISEPTNPDIFDSYLKGNRTLWDRYLYGSNRTLRGMDRFISSSKTLNINPEKSEKTKKSKYVSPNTAKEHKFETTFFPFKKHDVGKDNIHRRAVIRRYHDIQNGKFSNKNMKSGNFNIGNEKVNVYSSSANGKPIISIFTSKGKKEFKNLEEAKKEIARIIKDQRYNILPGKKYDTESMKKLGETLLKLKLKGWLKQGGRITDTQIDNFLRNYK